MQQPPTEFKTSAPNRRTRLPDRRANETIAFEHGGSQFLMTIGFFPDGTIAEVFLNAARANSALDTLVSDAAILVSLCLQHGVSLQTIGHALKSNSPVSAGLDRITP